MQNFGFLNHGFVKDVLSRGFHLQYLFPDRNRLTLVQTSGRKGICIPDHCDGIFSFGYPECIGECLDPGLAAFQKTSGRNSGTTDLYKRRISYSPINSVNKMIGET
jgi:hypothetical protein